MAIRSQFLSKLWTGWHSLALGFLFGVSLMTAAIWYGVPTMAQSVNVSIQNPSFELPTSLPNSSACGNYTSQSIPGWTFIQPPNTSYGVMAWTCGTVPDGKQVAFLDGATMVQDLGVSAGSLQAQSQDYGTYLMTFYVGNFYGKYPGYWEAKILVGPPIKTGQTVDQWLAAAHELCSLDGPATNVFKEILFPCLAPTYLIYDNWPPPWANPAVPANPNDHIIISLSANGWELSFDKVSLGFTPSN